MNRLEQKKIAENMAKIRAENRKAIAQTIAARVLQKLAESPNLQEGISGQEIAEVMRPMTDNWLDFENTAARKFDFDSLEDLINEVTPLIYDGLARARENKKTAA